MYASSQSLRVALVFKQTVYRERTFRRTSESVVSFGTDQANTFVTPSGGFGQAFEMFERDGEGYLLRFTKQLEGSIRLDEVEYRLEELVDGPAIAVDTISTGQGRSMVYELAVSRGDWGLVKSHNLEVYFQVLGRPDAVAGRGVTGFDSSVLGAVGLAAFAHLLFLLACFLAFEITPELRPRTPLNEFVEAQVGSVQPPDDPKRSKFPDERETGKRAGGKEGEFGSEDKTGESKVSKNDGPKQKKVDPTKVGMTKLLASKNIGSGPLEKIFDDQGGISMVKEVDMGGDEGELKVGRGQGGMGIRDGGTGGGGDGFGGIHKLGEALGGGGGTTGARLAKKQKKKVEPQVSTGEVATGDYCDRSNLRQVVESKSASIQYCYERRLQANPDLKGKIVAQWKIGLDGTVTSTSIAQSTMGDREVESCIMRVIRRMRFEKPDGGMCVVSYPFVFSG